MKRRRKSIKEKCEKTIYTWITTSIGGRVFFQRGNLSSKNCWGQPCLSLDILFVQHQHPDDPATFGNYLMRFRRDLFVCCFTSTSSDTMPKAKHIYRCASHHEESLQLTECLSNGNLAAHLRSEMDENITLPWLKRLDMAIDIANPLDHLNNYGIIHRNVKSSNFLLDVNCCAKVGNLHLSQKLPDGVPVDATHVTSDRAGSSGYMGPDYLTKGQLSVKNDVYSFGVVLCELLSSKLAKDWVLNEVDNLVSILSRKIENQVFEISVLKIFHGAELEEATNNFDTCLGKGGYGSIYYGKLGREVAVKCFHVENETEETVKQFMKETAILSLLHHQNLVSL
ncbi:LEAF RUST 10 DISEASE-RESISTANCE LOCUS RECEPTOR-LIKE PROTEIN KINASE-like 1.4 [Glycine soja]